MHECYLVTTEKANVTKQETSAATPYIWEGFETVHGKDKI